MHVHPAMATSLSPSAHCRANIDLDAVGISLRIEPKRLESAHFASKSLGALVNCI